MNIMPLWNSWCTFTNLWHNQLIQWPKNATLNKHLKTEIIFKLPNLHNLGSTVNQTRAPKKLLLKCNLLLHYHWKAKILWSKINCDKIIISYGSFQKKTKFQCFCAFWCKLQLLQFCWLKWIHFRLESLPTENIQYRK